jgi:hypothetical protein
MDIEPVLPGIANLAPTRATFCATVRITDSQRRAAFNLGGVDVE